MKRFSIRLITGFIAICVLASHSPSSFGGGGKGRGVSQASAAADPKAEKVKSQVERVALGNDITANMKDGKQYCGAINDIQADSFQIADVDLKQVVTVKYAEVAKVWKGYGGKGAWGKRVNPRQSKIIGLAVGGGLIVLLLVLLSMDK